MTIIQTLKTESLRLRKARNPVAASITFAIAEIEAVGKNSGNRATTEEEAAKVVQKLVATLQDNLKYALRESDKNYINEQISILQAVLPQQISEAEIRSYLYIQFGDGTASKGEMMKSLKQTYGPKVDLAKAGIIMKELFNV